MPAPTATSVIIAWTQPEFSLPVTVYFIIVTRIAEQALCSDTEVPDQTTTTQPDTTSTTLTGLQEFSNYRITIIANFNDQFGGSYSTSSSRDFTTPSAGKTLSRYNGVQSQH